MKRIISAFLLAPFPVALIQSTVVAIWPKPGMGVFEHPQSMFVAMCLLFYAIELLLGLPLHVAFRKRGPHRMMTYALTGALLALIPITVGLALTGSLSAYAVTYNLALFGFGGFFAGWIFWYLVSPRVKTAGV